MSDIAWFALLLLAGLSLFLTGALRVLRDDQRMAVLRAGTFHRVVGPGLAFTVPVLERAVVVDLSKHVSRWRFLTDQQLADEVITFASRVESLHPS